ncbi:hypothetical protein GJAV_G00097620 [Gymnothorax javanicus]|nr:hypothetical protein GJAV_G00097620 [Gymnothorax javanicus]
MCSTPPLNMPVNAEEPLRAIDKGSMTSANNSGDGEHPWHVPHAKKKISVRHDEANSGILNDSKMMSPWSYTRKEDVEEDRKRGKRLEETLEQHSKRITQLEQRAKQREAEEATAMELKSVNRRISSVKDEWRCTLQ